MRLNKWLVMAGVAPARRKADEIILAGRVRLESGLATLGTQVEVDTQIWLDDKFIQTEIKPADIISYHKRVGEICSHTQQGESPTIFASLPTKYATYKIVGRLDKASEGLVVLTNDGAIAQRLAHPSGGHLKRYRVETTTAVTDADIRDLQSGTVLDGIATKFALMRELSQAKTGQHHYEVVLGEGRNRQIRRSLELRGYRISRLIRQSLGSYELGDLPVRQWRQEASRG